MSYYLVLVSPLDAPLYEAFLTSSKASSTLTVPPQTSSFSIFGSLPAASTTSAGAGLGINQPTATETTASNIEAIGYGQKTGPNGRHVMQLIAHASIDVLEDVMWSNGACYLKTIDKFMEWTVSAFLTTGGTLFSFPQVSSWLTLLRKRPEDAAASRSKE